MNKVIDMFLKLVQIDSPSGSEQDMILFVKKWLEEHKLSYKADKLGNILAKNNGVGESIVFCVHLDTVQHGEKIKPVIKNGVIKSSRNTILGADNKAAVACLLTTIEKYLKNEKNPKAFELLFTVKEETGGGVEYFPFQWIESKKGLVFDSANPLGGIVLRSPYIVNFYAEFIGKEAHSSTPEKGKNALIPAINSVAKIKAGKLDNGETTINVGKINGGTGINIIPGKIKIAAELRSYQKNFFDKHLKQINHLFKKEAEKSGILLSLYQDGYCPGYAHDKENSFIKEIGKVYKDLGLKPTYYDYSGVSDANILISAGLNIVNLSDGVENPHTTKEQIKIENLIKLKEIILTFLVRRNFGTSKQ